MILLHVPERVRSAEVLAVGLLDGQPLIEQIPTTLLPVQVAEAITRYVADEQPDSAAGALARITMPGSVPSTVLLAGLGDAAGRDLRIAGVRIGRAISAGSDRKRYCVAIDAPAPAASQALAEGLVLGGYRFSMASTATDALHTVELAGELDHGRPERWRRGRRCGRLGARSGQHAGLGADPGQVR